MVNKEKLLRMAKLTGFFMFGYLLTGCSSVDAYNVLSEKCKNGDYSDKKIAQADFLLAVGSSIDLGINNTVTGIKDGGFSVVSNKSVLVLPNGATVVQIHNGFSENYKVAVYSAEKDGKSEVNTFMNCEDKTVAPSSSPKTNQ